MQDELGVFSQSEWTRRKRFRNKYATNKYRYHNQRIIKKRLITFSIRYVLRRMMRLWID